MTHAGWIAILPSAFVLSCCAFFTAFLESKEDNFRDQTLKNAENLICWENRSLAEEDSLRVGPGEHGNGLHLSSDEYKVAKNLLGLNGFNLYVSDRIALDRSIKDIRHPQCQNLLYPRRLPSVSVIIPFFEEHLSTLLRTIVTTLKRSPVGVVKELILVDDGSTRQYLKENLESFIRTHYSDSPIQIIRLSKRQGLIRAKIIGARHASGEIYVFLDSHCEPNVNWLPPLLSPIVSDYRTVTCPFIDIIDPMTFEYRPQDEGGRGIFSWEFSYKRLPRVLDGDTKPWNPFSSPVMAGGLFAISRKWFWELGGYDPGLEIWGGEQFELSFKVWMCGGQILDIPCSRVGHVYRLHQTNFLQAATDDFLFRNYRRVAEVWMDEYQEYIYLRNPQCLSVDPGDLRERHALRKRLKCKSFKWFLDTVAHDLVKKYPLIDPVPAAAGDLRPFFKRTLCLDGYTNTLNAPIGLRQCVGGNRAKESLQKFYYSHLNDIRINSIENCLDILGNKGTEILVYLYPCHGNLGSQQWLVQSVNGDHENPVRLVNVQSQRCLESNTEDRRIFLSPCTNQSGDQQWIWEKLQFDLAEKSRQKENQ